MQILFLFQTFKVNIFDLGLQFLKHLFKYASIEIQLRFSTGYISECHYCIYMYSTFVFLKRAHIHNVAVAFVRPFLFSLENEILTAVQVLEFIQCCQLP